MINRHTDVFVYVFDAKDAVSTEDKLKSAVAAYIRANPTAVHDVAEISDGLLQIGRTPQGKPYLPGCPGIHVSVSHSGDYWVCGVSEVNLGIDIQEHTTLRNETTEEAAARLLRIARRHFHSPEQEYLASSAYRRFFRVWTAKESYVKYTGRGIDDHFSEFCVIPPSEGAASLPDLSPNGDPVCWSTAANRFAQMELAPKYTLCVCVDASVRPTIRLVKQDYR